MQPILLLLCRKCLEDAYGKLGGHGKYRKFEHPEIETFGENLGEITTEIFGYDVGSTGFHTILKNVADRKNSYEKALNEFQGELGKEAKINTSSVYV